MVKSDLFFNIHYVSRNWGVFVCCKKKLKLNDHWLRRIYWDSENLQRDLFKKNHECIFCIF